MKTTGAPPDDSAQWLPVAVVAARLGISERTVQRRAKRGELEAREVSDEQGKRLLIRLDLPTGADNLPTPIHAQTLEAADISGLPADKLPTRPSLNICSMKTASCERRSSSINGAKQSCARRFEKR